MFVINLTNGLTEIGNGRSFNAIGIATEINRVEVILKNLLFRDHCFQFECKESFADFAIPGSILGEVGDLGVLLCDGGSTLGVATRDIVECSSRNSYRRNPAVVIEVTVFGGQNGHLDINGNLIQWNTASG